MINCNIRRKVSSLRSSLRSQMSLFPKAAACSLAREISAEATANARKTSFKTRKAKEQPRTRTESLRKIKVNYKSN